MKKHLIGIGASLFLASLSLLAVDSVNLSYTWISDRIVKIEEVDQLFSQGKLLNNVILECTEGSLLPLKISIKGDLLSLDSEDKNPMTLKILKTFYIRCDEKEQFFFSTDLQEWKEFSEFSTGMLNALLKSENGVPTASLDLQLNHRS